jgi:two-component system response regulator
MADDDEDDCILVKAAFEEMGLSPDLHFVSDGRELLDYVRNDGHFADPVKYPRPDVILLDLNMPRLNGREALPLIKSDPKLRDIPVLVLTTSREEHDVALSKQAGAASFLSKPEAFEDLRDMLQSFCTAIIHNRNVPFQVLGCDR